MCLSALLLATRCSSAQGAFPRFRHFSRRRRHHEHSRLRARGVFSMHRVVPGATFTQRLWAPGMLQHLIGRKCGMQWRPSLRTTPRTAQIRMATARCGAATRRYLKFQMCSGDIVASRQIPLPLPGPSSSSAGPRPLPRVETARLRVDLTWFGQTSINPATFWAELWKHRTISGRSPPARSRAKLNNTKRLQSPHRARASKVPLSVTQAPLNAEKAPKVHTRCTNMCRLAAHRTQMHAAQQFVAVP